jgi:hypothetical protein
MPQLVVLGLLGAGLYAGYRLIAREVRRAVAAAEAELASRKGMPRDLGTLEWDAEARVYRPTKR